LNEIGIAYLVTECGHFFHLTCLEPWLYKNGSCPICRAAVVRYTVIEEGGSFYTIELQAQQNFTKKTETAPLSNTIVNRNLFDTRPTVLMDSLEKFEKGSRQQELQEKMSEEREAKSSTGIARLVTGIGTMLGWGGNPIPNRNRSQSSSPPDGLLRNSNKSKDKPIGWGHRGVDERIALAEDYNHEVKHL
jgi:hypothetical protein